MKDRTSGDFLLFCFVIFCFLPGSSLAAQSARSPQSRSALPKTPAARPAGEIWAPADVDSATPFFDPKQACVLPDVLDGAGKKVQEMIRNLDRFTAVEMVQHQNVDREGKLGKAQARSFEYLVSFVPQKSGYLAVNELRRRAEFPEGISTVGTPSLVLIFLPLYSRDFQMSCAGLGQWQGKPAWQVRFEQRADRPNHMSTLVMKWKVYNLRLRGRAWILADSYQVAHLETDLADTIPEIGLRLEHMKVEYGPVAFPARQTELWLPLDAELYLDSKGHRFYRRHSFTNFTLFSVDVEQQFINKQGNSN